MVVPWLLAAGCYGSLVLLLGPAARRTSIWPILEPLPFAILAAAALVLDARWEEIPARFAVHFGADGSPNGWAPRTPAGVFGPLVAGAAVAAVLALVRAAMASERLVVHGPAGGAHGRRYTSAILLGVETWVAVVFATTSFLALGATLRVVLSVVLGGVVLLIVSLAASTAAFTRHPPDPGGTPTGGWRAGGLVYRDEGDPDLWIPKRIGIGWTLNFAHPAAWWVMALLLLVPLAIVGTLFLVAKSR
jgi:uncharacterized membrane protein